jgi:hypothetical protein
MKKRLKLKIFYWKWVSSLIAIIKQRNFSLEFWRNDSPNLIYKIINNNSNISNFSTITNYEIDDENK